MPVFGHQPFTFGHPFGRDMVKVGHTEMRPAGDVFLAFATIEAHRYGKTRTGSLDMGSRRSLLLLQTVTMLLRAGSQLRIDTNQFGHNVQGTFCGLQVGVAFEKADECVFHKAVVCFVNSGTK